MIKVRHLGGLGRFMAQLLGGSAAEAVVLGRVLGRFYWFWDRLWQNVRHA